jgi:hypothetical protein
MKPILLILALLVAGIAPLSPALAQVPSAHPQSITQLDADAAQARQRVIEIVNQPVTHLPRTDEAAVFSPGWFHPGAIKPDFNTVDVRATRELTYDNAAYVTSDLNPTEMFIGRDLEFNAMTKYFYADRTLPKARLSDAEMLEVNRLYRIIGRDEQAHAARGRMTALLWIALALGLLVLFLVRRFL